MSFLNALCQHIWLLLTMRHDGRGLPEQMTGVVVFALLYVLAKIFAFPDLGEATLLDGAFWLFMPVVMVLLIGRQLACGLMLINTIAVTATGIYEKLFPVEIPFGPVVSIWSISAGLFLLLRAAKRKSPT